MPRGPLSRFYLASLCLLILSMSLHAADAFAVPIEPYEIESNEKPLLAKAHALKQAGKLMARGKVVKALRKPSPERIQLAAPATQPLRPREVAAKGRLALMRVGWFFLPKDTDEWHVNLAGGFAISTDGAVVTCYHCIPPEDMREGYLIASDAAGEVYPVRAILAADEAMDAAIVRVAGGPFIPLALNDTSAPGDAAFCFSDPLGMAGYFSAGIVNRYFWSDGLFGDPSILEGARRLRMHVSTDWAPGSSGAAVLDDCGNAIGHVCSIQSLFSDEDPEPEVATDEKGDAPTDDENVAKPEKKEKHDKSEKSDKGDKRDKDKEKEKKGEKNEHRRDKDKDKDKEKEKEKEKEKIEPQAEPPPPADRAPMITLHEAIPVRALKVLIAKLNQ